VEVNALRREHRSSISTVARILAEDRLVLFMLKPDKNLKLFCTAIDCSFVSGALKMDNFPAQDGFAKKKKKN
jgi:hypothetical protein